MNAQIFCPLSNCSCDHPQRCQQTCQATLTTGNGGNVITKGKPLPARPKTFQPDYGITRARYTYSFTTLSKIIVSVFAVVMFVVWAINR